MNGKRDACKKRDSNLDPFYTSKRTNTHTHKHTNECIFV